MGMGVGGTAGKGRAAGRRTLSTSRLGTHPSATKTWRLMSNSHMFNVSKTIFSFFTS